MDFEPFLAYWQGNRKCSAQTIRSYRNDLKLFQAFMDDHGHRRITQVNHQVLTEYINYMRQKENPRFGRTGLADASIQRRLASLCSYIDYIRATSNPKLHNPIRDFTHRWHKNDDPKPADEISLSHVLQGIDNLRDKVLVTLFLATGLRVSEMHSLNRDTIKFESEIDDSGVERLTGVGLVVGKGSKIRKFYVDEPTLLLYAEYLDARKDDDSPLFLSEQKKRLSVRAIQHMLATWCKRLGVSPIRVHQLRHSFATRLANAHISGLVLRDLLGHRSLTTSQRYFTLHDTTVAQGYFSAMEFVNETSAVVGQGPRS